MLSWLRGRRKDDPDLLLARGEVEQALAAIEAMLRDDPKNESLRRTLAEALNRKGDRKRAAAVLTELAEEFADDGQVTKSFAALKQAEQLAPSSTTTRRAADLMRTATQQTRITFTTTEIVLEDWLAESEERVDFLGSPLFADLSERERRLLFDELQLRLKHPGALLYAAGEPTGGLFILASGAVRIYEPSHEQRHRQVALLREGDIFGASGVLGKARRSYTVTAACPCEILEIDRGLFERLAARHTKLRERVRELVDMWATAPPPRP